MVTTHQPEKQYYTDSAVCPICRKHFDVFLVRSISLRPKIQHTDFHVEYYGASPAHYVVQICPNCLFASYRTDFNKVFGATQSILIEDEARRKELFGIYDFTAERDSATVQASYELGLHCYELRKNTRLGIKASLYLHMAWLAREEGRMVQEQHYMTVAYDLYNQAFSSDPASLPKDDIKQTYLIGDLALRLGHKEEAIQWFQKAMKHPAINEFPGMSRRIRDEWGDIRDGKIPA